MAATKQSAVQAEAWKVSADMRQLHEDFRAGSIKRDDADTVANIAGKNLKALALIGADQDRELAQTQTLAKAEAIGKK